MAKRGRQRTAEPRVLLGAYTALLSVVLVLGLPFWAVRLLTTRRWRSGLRQRLGALPPAVRAGGGPAAVWVHAVSVGEVLAAAALLESMRPWLGEGRVLLSTTTEAGQQLAVQRFPRATVFFLPLDLPFLLRPIFRAARPRLLLLMESELWPNLLAEAKRAGCGVVVVNARISDRSFPRYRRLRRLWRPLLGMVDLFLAQGEETAGRLQQLGVDPTRIRVTGNLKYDLQPARRGAAFRALERLAAGPLFVAGSTLAGEENLLLAAWLRVRDQHPSARLVLAPRQPARFAAVADLVREAGLPVARVSTGWPDTPERDAILLLDTIGDLSGVYELVSLAFVGGSLVPAGGHNPLEPARFGVPVVLGSSFANFREIVTRLVRADAIEVLPEGLSAAKLGDRLAGLLGDRQRLEELGRHAAAVVRQEAGAADRTAAALAEAFPVSHEVPA